MCYISRIFVAVTLAPIFFHIASNKGFRHTTVTANRCTFSDQFWSIESKFTVTVHFWGSLEDLGVFTPKCGTWQLKQEHTTNGAFKTLYSTISKCLRTEIGLDQHTQIQKMSSWGWDNEVWREKAENCHCIERGLHKSPLEEMPLYLVNASSHDLIASTLRIYAPKLIWCTCSHLLPRWVMIIPLPLPGQERR